MSEKNETPLPTSELEGRVLVLEMQLSRIKSHLLSATYGDSAGRILRHVVPALVILGATACENCSYGIIDDGLCSSCGDGK